MDNFTFKASWILVICAAGAADVSSSGRKSYDGYKVLRAKVEDEAQASALQQMRENGTYDFWREAVPGQFVDIITSPEQTELLGVWLEEQGITWSVGIEDVGVLIEDEKTSHQDHERTETERSMDWTNYHSVEDIYGWLDYLDRTCDFCEREVIGQSHEGQDMIVMKVCKGGCGNKPAMWIDSGIHAREWISPAVGTWMLNELVKNNAKHPKLTDGLDWYFLPLHNPDGYRKSRPESEKQDRLWRKTTTWHDGDRCQGTDPNRNWDFHWSEVGANNDSCSNSYHGPGPESEIEVRNVRDWILARTDKIVFFQTLHSYGQLILFPWGYTNETQAPYHDAMNRLAIRGSGAIHAVHGKNYEVKNRGGGLLSGTSRDWALGVARIPYVYCLELRPSRDGTGAGFLLDKEQIVPTAEEAWAFHKVAAEQMMTEWLACCGHPDL